MSFTSLSKKWATKDLILFFEQMEAYVSAGLSIDKSLEIIGQGCSRRQAKSVERVRADVMSGQSLSKSLSAYLGVSDALSALIQHGESGGGLPRAVSNAKRLLQNKDELSKKCVSALIYPIVIGIFASLLTIGLVRGVMPQITPMLKGLHVQLPLLTRIVMGVSDNLIAYGLYMLGALTIGGMLMIVLYMKIQSFRYICQSSLMHFPLVGPLVYSYALSLFLYSCGSLVDSGLYVNDAYARSSQTISFLPLSRMLSKNSASVQKGMPIGSSLLHSSRYVPAHVSPLLLAGEATGTLGLSLLRASAIIDQSIDHSLKRLTALIEPVMMAGMGTAIGGIALSIMMPIYDVAKVLQH